MARVKNIGGSLGGDDGDGPPPPPSDRGKGKQKGLASQKRKLVDKEVERAERVARMLDKVEQDDRLAGALRMDDSPVSTARAARATDAPCGSIEVGGQHVSLDDPSEVLPAEREAEQPQAETAEQSEQP